MIEPSEIDVDTIQLMEDNDFAEDFRQIENMRWENANLFQKLIMLTVHILASVFWHPYHTDVYQRNICQQEVNSKLQNDINFLKGQLVLKQRKQVCLAHKEEFYSKKMSLITDMRNIKKVLFRLRDECFQDRDQMSKPSEEIQMEVQHNLAKYERCMKYASLYTDLIQMIDNILSGVSLTEDLQSLNRIGSNNYSDEYTEMNNTIKKLVFEVRDFEAKKKSIQSSVLVGKSTDAEMAINVGHDIDSTKTQMLVDHFLTTGEIVFGQVQGESVVAENFVEA